jgi:hypothetical protein
MSGFSMLIRQSFCKIPIAWFLSYHACSRFFHFGDRRCMLWRDNFGAYFRIDNRQSTKTMKNSYAAIYIAIHFYIQFICAAPFRALFQIDTCFKITIYIHDNVMFKISRKPIITCASLPKNNFVFLNTIVSIFKPSLFLFKCRCPKKNNKQ